MTSTFYNPTTIISCSVLLNISWMTYSTERHNHSTRAKIWMFCTDYHCKVKMSSLLWLMRAIMRRKKRHFVNKTCLTTLHYQEEMRQRCNFSPTSLYFSKTLLFVCLCLLYQSYWTITAGTVNCPILGELGSSLHLLRKELGFLTCLEIALPVHKISL